MARLTTPVSRCHCSRYGTTTAWTCIKALHREAGLAGFYKGITASYFGISETIIHFVIYEFLKSKLQERTQRSDGTGASNFAQFMVAGAISKTFASVVAYPHGQSLWSLSCSSSHFPRRGGPDETPGGGQQIPDVHSDDFAGGPGGGPQRTVSRSGHSAPPPDTEHRRYDGHVRAHRLFSPITCLLVPRFVPEETNKRIGHRSYCLLATPTHARVCACSSACISCFSALPLLHFGDGLCPPSRCTAARPALCFQISSLPAGDQSGMPIAMPADGALWLPGSGSADV